MTRHNVERSQGAQMGNKLMDINALIDNDWVDFSRQTITGSGSKYRYYIHVKSESIEISDLSVNSSSLIKSLPCYSISEFLENIK